MKPLQIPRPEIKGATELNPMALNKVHFDPKHTVLTPGQLTQKG